MRWRRRGSDYLKCFCAARDGLAALRTLHAGGTQVVATIQTQLLEYAAALAAEAEKEADEPECRDDGGISHQNAERDFQLAGVAVIPVR